MRKEKLQKMQLEPKDLYEKLEFDKILQLLEEACLGDLGKAKVQEIKPEVEKVIIERKLGEVNEYKLSIEEKDDFPISTYSDISEDLRRLEVVDYVLPEEGLQRINRILISIRDIFKFFNGTRKKIYPLLYENIRHIPFDEELIQAIDSVIDEEGVIRSDASPALKRIRRSTHSKQMELEKAFRNIIRTYREKGWLTDSVESFRNGRRVLSVPSEHKRKIRGIIHDESTTGKTAFIEPEGVIDINNDIFDLETEEKREIYRILKELSATLRPYCDLLNKYQILLSVYDLIQAKARMAVRMNANMPKVLDKPHFGIRMGYHPLLYLKNKLIGKATVPFDLTLIKPNRILVLSGPNAGGKSITMKATGLMQLMVQSGMLIPVDPESEMGVFNKVFADIGDQQSIEDDLSTYSSRLHNMRVFLEQADKHSMILIDEFGSGTDPKIGGAIAEAILNSLNYKKVFGVITTHYSNLKIFAFKTVGIVNGSMTFDKDNLAPTYELKVGRPGSSYAFEIAQKSGLDKRVLKYAKHKTGKNEKAIDQLLVDLQREKQELEERLDSMDRQKTKLEKLIKNYEQLHKELEFRRMKFKLESKEQVLQQAAQNNKEFERIIREIREEKNLEKAKKKAAEVKKEKEELVEQVTELREEIYYKPTAKEIKEGPIKVGDYVKLRTGGSAGTVESIDKNKAVIQLGLMRVTVKLRDLQHAKAPLEIKSTKSVQTDTFSQSANFESKIDIRGMSMEEAQKVVEDFVDQALISSVDHLRILHGKGNGVLRKAVKMKLKEYDVEMKIYHPEANAGGDGVTLIEIK
jgi:DNA mismatch repair protein MutS2